MPQQPSNNDFKYRLWTDHIVWGFVLLAAIGVTASSMYTGDWVSNTVFVAVNAAAGGLVLLLARKQKPPELQINNASREALVILGWYAIFLAGSFILKGSVPLGDEFGKWVTFILIPVLVLYAMQGRGRKIKEVLKSIGLRREGLGKALLLGLAAYAVTIPLIPLIYPAVQLDKLYGIFNEPLQAAILIVVGLTLSLVTAAATEEVLFRGIIQSRLAKMLNSEVRACLITAFLFGIYHLPYAYFLDSWPTYGNLGWAASSVLAEQMVAGVVLGIIWMRTHNLAGSWLFHGLVNLTVIMTSIHIGHG